VACHEPFSTLDGRGFFASTNTYRPFSLWTFEFAEEDDGKIFNYIENYNQTITAGGVDYVVSLKAVEIFTNEMERNSLGLQSGLIHVATAPYVVIHVNRFTDNGNAIELGFKNSALYTFAMSEFGSADGFLQRYPTFSIAWSEDITTDEMSGFLLATAYQLAKAAIYVERSTFLYISEIEVINFFLFDHYLLFVSSMNS